MKKHLIVRLTLLVAFTASVALAEAGQAVPRHGGSSSGSSSGSSGGSSSGGSSGGSSSSGGGGSTASSGGGSSDSGSRAAPRRHGDGGSQAGRGKGGDSGNGSTGAVRRGGGSDNNRPNVPDYSRPSGGGNVVGYAVPRHAVRPPGRPGGDYNYWYSSPHRFYYYPWGFGSFGLGYIMDPFWWGPGYGYGYPYGYGDGYGYGGYGYGGGYGGGYDPSYGSYSSGGSQYDEDQGGLRIKVKPRDAKVKIDGYFVGTVDDFDGNFQKVRLDDGPHKVELSLDGYQSVAFDVLIVSGQTTTYKGTMQQR